MAGLRLSDLLRLRGAVDAATYGQWAGILAQHHTKAMGTEAVAAKARELLPRPMLLQLNSFLPPSHRNSATALPAAGAAAAGLHQQATTATTAAAASATPNPTAAASAPAQPPAGSSDGGMLAHLRDPGWRAQLERECGRPYFKAMCETITAQRQRMTVYPPEDRVFSAFNHTPFGECSMVHAANVDWPLT